MDVKNLKTLYLYNPYFCPLPAKSYGDLTYNVKRGLLGAISQSDEIAYHLFQIDTDYSNAKDIVKLSRRSKWHPQYSTNPGRFHFVCELLLIQNS